jgi:hypothetical protein
MTEPVPEATFDVDAEVDELLAGIVAAWGTDDLPRARGILRRALQGAWYSGESAAWRRSHDETYPVRNPWLRSTK